MKTSITQAIACLALATCGAGCSSFYRWLPFENELTVASVSEPPTAIEPSKGKATIIFVERGSYDGGKKSFTHVLEDGTFLGQTTARSYFVAEIPAGHHTLIRGLPEFGPDGACFGRRDDFVAGQIYVYEDGVFVPAKSAARDLSLNTFLKADTEAGQAAVTRDTDAYRRTCIDNAMKGLDAEEASPSFASQHQVKTAEVAVGEFTVPSPP